MNDAKIDDKQIAPADATAHIYHAMITVMVRGLISMTSGSPEEILGSMAAAFGRVMGESYGGEVDVVNKAREKFSAKFSEACLAQKIITPQEAQQDAPPSA